MSESGRGGEKSSSGTTRTPVREVPVPSAAVDTVESTAPGTKTTSLVPSSAVTDEKSTGPLHQQGHDTNPTSGTATKQTESTSPSARRRAESDEALSQPRQVIAVSVSKGPSAFFNLARKFLVTDEICDLSALEGAIVSAVDAAHLLERSKIATIIQIQTSYVAVEPKKKREQGPGSSSTVTSAQPEAAAGSPRMVPDASTTLPHQRTRGLDALAVAAERGRTALDQTPPVSASAPQPAGKAKSSEGLLRRARIVITVRRTEAYKKWLEENPIQDIIHGEEEHPI